MNYVNHDKVNCGTFMSSNKSNFLSVFYKYFSYI